MKLLFILAFLCTSYAQSVVDEDMTEAEFAKKMKETSLMQQKQLQDALKIKLTELESMNGDLEEMKKFIGDGEIMSEERYQEILSVGGIENLPEHELASMSRLMLSKLLAQKEKLLPKINEIANKDLGAQND